MRELNLAGLSQEQQNWVNRHTVYTHGFGVVAATVTALPLMVFPVVGSSPSSKGEIGEYEPRVYFAVGPDYLDRRRTWKELPTRTRLPGDNAPGGQVSTTFKVTAVLRLGTLE